MNAINCKCLQQPREHFIITEKLYTMDTMMYRFSNKQYIPCTFRIPDQSAQNFSFEGAGISWMKNIENFKHSTTFHLLVIMLSSTQLFTYHQFTTYLGPFPLPTVRLFTSMHHVAVIMKTRIKTATWIAEGLKNKGITSCCYSNCHPLMKNMPWNRITNTSRLIM